MSHNVFLYQAALYCEDCGNVIRTRIFCDAPHKCPADPADESSYDSDDFPKGPYGDGGGEADSPQHCDGCGVFLENPLTEAGVAYVQEALDKRPDGGGTAHRVWKPFYAAQLAAQFERNACDEI